MAKTEQDTPEKSEEQRPSCLGDAIITSLKNFRSTPFVEASWEIISRLEMGEEFLPLELPVVPTAKSEPDPMFEVFSEKVSQDRIWYAKEHSKTSPVAPGLEIDSQAVEAASKEGFERGKQQGIQEGKAIATTEAQAKSEELRQRTADLLANISQVVDERVERMEKESVNLALNISKKILAMTVEVKPDYILDILRQGLNSIGASKPTRVRVSHQDLEFLEIVGTPQDLAPEELGIEYVGDESIKSGCVVETDFGEIDVQLDSMWERIKEQLAEVCK